MKKIAIYGAGGFGRETRLLIDQINQIAQQWEFIGFFDDGESKNKNVIGGLEQLNDYEDEIYIVIAIADSKIRKELASKINNPNVKYPVLIHPSVIYDSRQIAFGEGSIITANNVFTSDIRIGRHNVVNLASTIGHDIITEDFCSIMPGVHLSGNVSIGEGTLIGTGARILQNLEIGSWSKVGAGAVVIEDVPDQSTVVGVPAKLIKKC